MYKGTIIENSLADKSILSDLKIEKTHQSGSWIIHDVLIDENQIIRIQKSLDNGPWYIHFWESGKDDIIVVFKNKMFTIRYLDKNTWADAIAYGKFIGISDEQLDFPINA